MPNMALCLDLRIRFPGKIHGADCLSKQTVSYPLRVLIKNFLGDIKMKKIIALLLAMVMLCSLVACGNEEAKAPEAESNNEAAADFKAGFIFLHDENSTYDLNFMNATKEACEALGVEYVIKVNIGESEACYDAAAELVDEGCTYIFAYSFGHEP